jgi:hypothetical protein
VQPSSGGGCWKLNPDYPLQREIWGITRAPVFYVTSGNDHGGKNSCLLSGDPCATIGQAVWQYYQLPWYGSDQYVSVGACTWNETISVSSPLFAAPSQVGATISPQLYLKGAGSDGTTIAGSGEDCGTIIATYGGSMVGVEALTLTANATACQSALFAQEGGVINVYLDVKFGAASQQHMHVEETGSQIEIWAPYTVMGGAAHHWGSLLAARSFITRMS